MAVSGGTVPSISDGDDAWNELPIYSRFRRRVECEQPSPPRPPVSCGSLSLPRLMFPADDCIIANVLCFDKVSSIS